MNLKIFSFLIGTSLLAHSAGSEPRGEAVQNHEEIHSIQHYYDLYDHNLKARGILEHHEVMELTFRRSELRKKRKSLSPAEARTPQGINLDHEIEALSQLIKERR